MLLFPRILPPPAAPIFRGRLQRGQFFIRWINGRGFRGFWEQGSRRRPACSTVCCFGGSERTSVCQTHRPPPAPPFLMPFHWWGHPCTIRRGHTSCCTGRRFCGKKGRRPDGTRISPFFLVLLSLCVYSSSCPLPLSLALLGFLVRPGVIRKPRSPTRGARDSGSIIFRIFRRLQMRSWRSLRGLRLSKKKSRGQSARHPRAHSRCRGPVFFPRSTHQLLSRT